MIQQFFKALAQQYQNKIFSSQNLRTCVFYKSLLLQKFGGADFKYQNSSLKLQPKNIQLRSVSSQIYAFSFFAKLSNQTNLRVLILNVPIVFFKFLSNNTQIRYFPSLIYTFLFFHKILPIGKFEGADLKYDIRFFKTLARKYPIKIFFFSKFRYLHFFRKFCNYRHLWVLISNITMVL